jgi:hypothetical protein
MKLFVFFLCALPCAVLLSCHKDNAKPAPTPPPVSPDTVGTVNLTLTMSADTLMLKSELIVSESGSGRILLDTVTPPGGQMNVTLHTSVTLFDMTRITYSALPSFIPPYTVSSIRAVNPVS